jgi:hypothetical protein
MQCARCRATRSNATRKLFSRKKQKSKTEKSKDRNKKKKQKAKVLSNFRRIAELRLTLKAGCRAGSPRDGRAPIAAKCKNSNSQDSKSHKLQNRKNRNPKNFHRIFFREIDREIACRKIGILVPGFESKTFASSLPGVLCFIRNVRGANLMRASSVPMKRRHLPG